MRAVAAVLLASALGAVAVRADDGPLVRTRQVVEQSAVIVKGPEDRRQKLAALSDLLRDYSVTLGPSAGGSAAPGRRGAPKVCRGVESPA